MKKSTKSLWIYAAVLMIIAIALIFITALTQAKLVNHDGNIAVLDTLNQTAQQNIAQLTEEKASIQNEYNLLKAKNKELEDSLTAIQNTKSADDAAAGHAGKVFEAYSKSDIETLKTLMSSITEPNQIDRFIPGLHALATQMLQTPTASPSPTPKQNKATPTPKP